MNKPIILAHKITILVPLPALLINIMLVYSYKRIQVIQYALNQYSERIEDKEVILT